MYEKNEKKWVKRFTACEPRLSESVKLYEALGFEVRLETPTPEDLNIACGKCFTEEDKKRYKTIYTRKKANITDTDYEELLS